MKLARTIQVSLLKYSVIFFLSNGGVYSFFFHCLLFICLFAFLTVLNIITQKCQGQIKCAQSWQILCNQFYTYKVLLEYITLVRAIALQPRFYSSNQEEALCTQNLKSSAFICFLGDKINREQELYQTIFFKTPL